MDKKSVFDSEPESNGRAEGAPSGGLVSIHMHVRAVGLSPRPIALERLLPRSAQRVEEPDGAGIVYYVLSESPEPAARFTIQLGPDAVPVVEVRPEAEGPTGVPRSGTVHPSRTILLGAARVAAGLLIARAWPIDKTARQAVAEALAGVTAEWDWTAAEVVTFINAIAQTAGDEHTYANVAKATVGRFQRGYTTKSVGTLRRYLTKPVLDAVIDWLSYEPPTPGASGFASAAGDAQANNGGPAGAATDGAPATPPRTPTAKPALADHARILDDFAKGLPAVGLVGEVTNAKLLFLVLVSRRLPRPLGVLVKGASSAGKNHLVGTVLRFFPPPAFYALTAASERALIYTEENFRHRIIVVYEGEALGGGFFAYVARSLMSEGRLLYETTIKVGDGYRTQRVEKEGPTGLITTTTAPRVHAENETRMISLYVDESSGQTAKIMQAYAAAVVGGPDPAGLGLHEWHTLAAWLDEGETRIVIPWAAALAEMIPPVAVRLRRDFPALLTLVEAHALVHRATRKKDDAGRIMAEVDDYEVVYDLVGDVFTHAAAATVPPAVREVVDAVKAGARRHIQVARRLGIDPSTAWRRVREAIEWGFIRNLEERPRQPADLAVLVEPPPDGATLLPTPDALRERLRVCTFAGGVGADPGAGLLLTLLAELAWRDLTLAGGQTVGPGEAAWRAWAQTASPEEINAAFDAARAAWEGSK